MKQRDIENIQRILMNESPWGHGVMGDEFENEMISHTFDMIKDFEHVGEFENTQIYYKEEMGNGNYFLWGDDELAAFYQFDLFSDNISTRSTWNNRKYKGILRKFLAEYILPKYEVIESDYRMSTHAFDMWKSMFIEYPNYEFYAKYPNGEIKEIKHYTDFIIYREPSFKGRYEHTTFVAKYNE